MKIGVPDELNAALRLPVKGGDITWTLDFGPFHVYNIQDRSGKILYTDFKTSYWDIHSYEFQLTDEKGEQWNCYCEYPDKGPWDPNIRCKFRDQTPPKGDWTFTDSLVVTAGDTLRIREYYRTEDNLRVRSPLLMGYLFYFDDEIRGLVDISRPSQEAVWIYPYMNPHRQRVIAAAATALIIKFRELQIDSSFENQKIIDRQRGP